VRIEHIMLYQPAAELESAMPDTVAVVKAAGGNTAPRSPCSFCWNACTARHALASGNEAHATHHRIVLHGCSVRCQPSKWHCRRG
jgi:hypothetical protein